MNPDDYNRRHLKSLRAEHVTALTRIAQAELGLTVDGMLGPKTRAALQTTREPSLSDVIVEVAREEIGNGETHGNNRGPDIDRYAAACGWGPDSGIAWCAAFAFYCYAQACTRLGRFRRVNGHVGARRLAENILAAGGTKVFEPQPGDLVLLERGSPGGSAHVRLVTDVAAAHYGAIEGNSGPHVRAHVYPLSDPDLLGFYRWPE